MKTIKQILLTIVMLFFSLTANAYDFEVDGIYYNIISMEDLTVEVTCGNDDYSGEVVIPETVVYGSKVLNVTSIREEAFSYCNSLASVVIGDNVTSIGEEAFSNCGSLTSVIIGNSVTSIGEDAFYRCSSLASVVIGDNVTSIGEYAFSYCSSLDSIVISNSVTSIGKGAFSCCFSLASVVIGDSVTSIGEYAFYYCNFTSIEIPNTVINIENNAFDHCSSLKELRIEDGIETLNLGYNEHYNNIVGYYYEGLFGNCHLEILYLGRNLSHSSNYTPFGGNETLTYVTIGNNVTSIREEAFSYCNSLASVVIGDNVTSIGEEAFSNCGSLTSVIIGNSVTSIGEDAFYRCSSLASVVIGDNVTSIGEYAFSYCSSLDSIVISNSVTSIGKGAFSNCGSLASVVIGDSVTSIEDYAFYSCSDLENIYLMATIPPSVGENNFTNKNYINTILHIPHGSLAIYQDATTWKNFWDIKEFYIDKYFYIRYFVDNVLFETDSIKHGSEIILRDEPIKDGYTFSGWSEAPETMPANDIEITGGFSVNTYTITYIVDGEIYATDSHAYGSEIILIDEPEKEGYTFSGWSEIPETMPAEDITIIGSFSINTYSLTYIVDGDIYAMDSLEYGCNIILIDEPVMEGRKFVGWSEVPNIMPAHDITVEGAFEYFLTYIVEGEVYAIDSLAYGSEIILIDAPEKEGYTFSGWSEIPETMPAEDITIIGSFSINTYSLTYIVDGEVYATDSLTYGSEIVLIDEPTKEGYTFSGWSEAPETMPAEDIEVTGSFIPTENVSEVEFDANIQTTNNGIILLNANNNWVRVYTINGILVKKIDNYTGEEITLNKGVYIVSVGNKAIKIML